jgi:hypothetical protein
MASSGVATSSKSIFGFDPRTVPGCQLWLDAADSATVGLSGSTVTTWKDKSINGVTLTAYGSPTTTTVNGRTSISLNGSTQYLQKTGFTPTNSATYVAWFAVANVTNYASATYACIVGTNYPTSHYCQNTLYVNSGVGVIFYRNADLGTSKILSSNSIYTNTLFQTETDYVTGQYQINLNGGSPISTTGGLTGAIDNGTVALQVGWDSYSADSYVTGTISECLLYTSPVSPANKQAIEGYLAWKWGLNISLPNYITTVFSPLSFTGCALWLDSSDSTTMFTTTGATTQSTNGTAVALWKDKSTSQNNFRATSGTPTLYTDGTKNVVNIPSGAIMTSASSITINSSSAFFIVHKITSIGDFSYLIGFSSGNGGNGDYSMRFLRGILNGTAGNTANSQDLANNYYVSGVLGGVANQYNNYYLVATNSTTSSSLTSVITLSTAAYSRYYAGYIAEFIYYPAGLTTSQFNQIQNYLCLKWNVIRPANHPYAQLIPYSRSFQPTDIPGCQLWLDAADTTNFSLTGSVINTWKDKSGNAYSGTSSGSPTLVTNSQNGLACVNFVASSSQYFDFGNIIPLIGTGISVFVVGKTTFASGVAQTFIGKSAATGQNGRWSLLYDANLLKFLIDVNVSGVSASTSPTSYSGVFSLFGGVWMNTSSYLYGNGIQIATAAISGTAAAISNRLYVGAYQDITGIAPLLSYYNNGTIGEILVYNTGLTTGQRQQIEGYLANKWNIQSALPVVSRSISQTFSYTGATQTFTVPTGVTSLTVSLSGAGGGGGGGFVAGGKGGLVTGTLSVSQTQVLTLVLGQGGSCGTNSAAATFGGGGAGGTSVNSRSSSGGGYSGIFSSSTLTQGNSLVIAGGGGGTGAAYGTGGDGGNPARSANYGSSTAFDGGGGTLTAGGSAGSTGSSGQVSGTAGSALQGGAGGAATNTGPGTPNPGAGGGGGYFGGGGGAGNSIASGGGGGGGHSFTTGTTFTLTSQTTGGGGAGGITSPNYTGGNGSITISYILATHPFYNYPPSSPSLFSPTNIGACAIWIDGNDPYGTGVVPASGATFATSSATIIDKSGNGYNLTPTATINYSTQFLNNMGVLNFGSARAQNSSFNWTTNFTQFVVVKGDAGTWGVSYISTADAYWSYVYAANNSLLWLGAALNIYDGSAGTSVFTKTGKGVTAWTIFCIGYTPGLTIATNYTLNGTSYTTTSTGGTNAPFNSSQATNLVLTLNGNRGNYYDTGVYVAEFIHYNATLSTSQRQQVEGYLAGKWGLQGLLPTTHPYYKSIPPAVSSYYFYESFEIPANLAATLGSPNVWGYTVAWNEWAVTGLSKAGVGSPWDPAGGTAAAGSWYAYMQGNGSTASRVFQGPVGYTATLSFSYGYRVGTSLVTSVSVTWTPLGGSAVTLPGSPFAMPSSATPWTTVTTSFVFTASSGTLIFMTNAPGQPDPSALIDNILIT